MATMTNETCDSDIYEDTDVMPQYGAPEKSGGNQQYECLRMDERKISNLNEAPMTKRRCGGRFWWVTGVVAVVLCIEITLVTGWVAGATWARNKPDWIKDTTANNQEVTHVNIVKDTLQKQMEEMQRAIEEKMTELQNTTQDKITNIENKFQMQLIELEKEVKAKSSNSDKDKMENRLTQIEASQTDIQNKKIAAFSVYVSGGDLELDADEVVPFDTALVDSMDGFDAAEHHYTCKTTGTYFFSLCISNGHTGH